MADLKDFSEHRIREAGGRGHCSEMAQRTAIINGRGAGTNVSPPTTGALLDAYHKAQRRQELNREGKLKPQDRRRRS